MCVWQGPRPWMKGSTAAEKALWGEGTGALEPGPGHRTQETLENSGAVTASGRTGSAESTA